jgi:hypothetical protein
MPPENVRIVRLQPWSLELVRSRSDRPWDEAVGLYENRKAAKHAAAALRAQATESEGVQP